MRLTSKKTEEILVEILTEEGLPLIKELIGKDNISEFTLANKTKKDIKVVRKMLYLLYNHNLVGFTRKKDKQKGWYIYYWTLLPDSIRFSYFKMKKKLLDRLKEQLNEESGELFFVCPNDCVRLNFDRAMDFEFHCPECGDLINQDDGQEKIDKLKKQIIRIEKEVTKLQEAREIRRKKVKKVKKEVKAKKKASVKKKTTTKKTKKSSKKKSDVKKKKSGKKISKKEVKKKVITKRKEKK